MEENNLNPNITGIKYGKKEIKEVTIYPLSVGDQFKITNLITEIVKNLVSHSKENPEETDFAFVINIMEAIESNLSEVLMTVADISKESSEEIINNMTNEQLTDLIEVVWSVNFEPALKKGKKLFERAKSMFNSRSLSQTSSDTTHSTD